MAPPSTSDVFALKKKSITSSVAAKLYGGARQRLPTDKEDRTAASNAWGHLDAGKVGGGQ